MTDNDESVYKELVNFLRSDRVDIQEAATDAVLLLLTQDNDNSERLIQCGAMECFSKLVSYPTKIGLNALQALVNLTASTAAAAVLEDETSPLCDVLISRATEVALLSSSTNESVRINLAVSLLANITRTERGAVEFLRPKTTTTTTTTTITDTSQKIKQEESAKPTTSRMNLLLMRFLRSNNHNNNDEEDDDSYQYVASILVNVTQIEIGRKFVMKQQEQKEERSSVLEFILPQLRSNNRIRRQGIAGTIKNCCLDSNNNTSTSCYWLLNHAGILTHLLYPLAGPEDLDMEDKIGLDPELWLQGPDKKREPCDATRLLLVETILLLCASGRQSRTYLRKHRTYVIIKLADMVEENEEVGDKIEQVVQYLRRDEHGEEDGSSDRSVENEWKQNMLSSSMRHVEENYNDVD